MTLFELAYLTAQPFLPPLHRTVKKRLLQIGRFSPGSTVLDVGGRKSHYTIGVPARVTITDLPRESAVQKQLHLGITAGIAESTARRRSNVTEIKLDDMTRSTLPDATFDYVLAVEVLEHVDEDAAFVHQVHRVLKPGGAFLMTTPNGDSVVNTNPDHRRHYTREQLRQLLADAFHRVDVEYAIAGGTARRLGLRSWSPRRPVQTVLSMAGNVVNSMQSASPSLKDDAASTRHLMAVAWKRDERL